MPRATPSIILDAFGVSDEAQVVTVGVRRVDVGVPRHAVPVDVGLRQKSLREILPHISRFFQRLHRPLQQSQLIG